MKRIKLHEGELNIMELLWSNQELQAKDIAKIVKEYIGWEKNTTYTVIHRLIEKDAIKREDPGFFCTPKVSKEEIQKIEVEDLLDKMFNGSLGLFFADYLKNRTLTKMELLELECIINEQREKIK